MPNPVTPNTWIGSRYRIDASLGAGAMGEVFRAFDADAGRAVALKLIRADDRARVKVVRRFLREARALAQLESPHVVRTLDFGAMRWSAGGWQMAASSLDVLDDVTDRIAHAGDLVPYLVMELVGGRPLSDLLTAGACLPATRLVGIADGVAQGLAHVHLRGLVHRDVKPSNILVGERDGRDHPWLIDFGVVKDLEGANSDSLTQGHAIGTPMYFSPEQARGEAVGPATDLWAVGVLLYRALSGRQPHEAPTVARLVLAIGHDRATPLAQRQLQVPASSQLVDLVDRLVRVHGDRPIASASELAGLLRRLPEAQQHAEDAGHVHAAATVAMAPVDRATVQESPAAETGPGAEATVGSDAIPTLTLPATARAAAVSSLAGRRIVWTVAGVLAGAAAIWAVARALH